MVKARSKYINVADKMCEFNDSFMLYMTTRLPNPHLSPENQAKVNLVAAPYMQCYGSQPYGRNPEGVTSSACCSLLCCDGTNGDIALYRPGLNMLFPTMLHPPQTTVVDFTVTQKGLEEQLLGGVIQKEQRSLEEQLKNVLEEVSATSDCRIARKTSLCPTLCPQREQRSLWRFVEAKNERRCLNHA